MIIKKQPVSEEDRRKLSIKMICQAEESMWKFEYKRTQNPLFLMRAYQVYRKYKLLPVPEWIMEYFDRATDRLIKKAERRRDGNPPPKARAPVLVHDAFEMGLKDRDIFNDYAKVFNHYLKLEDILMELTRKYPELLGHRQRARLIDMAVEKFNENLPESECISSDAADKWVKRHPEK